MRILFNTNVVLDVLLKREPHEQHARWLVNQVENDQLDGLLGSTTLTTIYYVASKAIGEAKTRQDLRSLLQLFEVAPVGRAVLERAVLERAVLERAVLERALDLGFTDYEDAVLHEAARHANADAIVTRNTADFEKATLGLYTPVGLQDALQ